jgi:SAM-dependent methyltransferase
VAEELPVPDRAFDRGLSQFALMFCTDRAAAIAELRRVVRPGGTIAIATWADLDATPGYAAMIRLLRRLVGDHAAAALSAPFAIGRPAQLSELMRPTFPDVDVRQVDGVARFPSVESWVRTDIDAWTLREMIDDAQMDRLLAEARTDLAPFAGPGGAVSFPAPALIATATC